MSLQKGFYACLISGFLLLAGWRITNDRLLLSLSLFSWALVFRALLTTLTSLGKLDITRKPRSLRLQVGRIYDEVIEIQNQSSLTKLWVEIRDLSSSFCSTHSYTVTNLKPGESRSHHVQVFLNQRGNFSLGSIRLTSGDPFGFIKITKTIFNSRMLLVYPYFPIINSARFRTGREMYGQNFTRYSPLTTPQASSLREYQTGDPLNRIHWPAIMSKNKLMVKEYDEDAQASIRILLDAQAGTYSRQKPKSSEIVFDWNFLPISRKRSFVMPEDGFEYAVSAAACLAEFSLRQKTAVGLAAYGAHSIFIQPNKTPGQLNKILKN